MVLAGKPTGRLTLYGDSGMSHVLRLLATATVGVISTVGLAVALLCGTEFARLVRWKNRRCPRCQGRLAFPGWDWGDWHNRTVRHTREVNGEVRASPWVVVRCPHCTFEIAVRKAPLF